MLNLLPVLKAPLTLSAVSQDSKGLVVMTNGHDLGTSTLVAKSACRSPYPLASGSRRSPAQ